MLRRLCATDGITFAAPCLTLAIESEAEERCHSWITLCCAAWGSESSIINLGVSHLDHWRCWLQEQGPHSLDKNISDTPWNHLEFFQATIQRYLYSSFCSFMNCLWRIRLVEISLAKCSGALYFNRKTIYCNTCSVIFWKVNVAEVFFASRFSLHLNLSSVSSLCH